MPKISVWLTSYNHEKFIRQSIESILSQTYSDFELFIIDDCSSDNSWNIIQQYAQKDERIRPVRHEQNYGRSGMREMLDELRGEYVAIAHCDDVWAADKLEKQIQVLEENKNVAACFTRVEIIDDNGNIFTDEKHPYSKVFDQPNRTRYEWLNYFFYKGNCLCHPSVLIRKNAYTEFDIMTKGLHGYPDFCQWIRLCKKADIFIIQERLTKFRVHGDGSNTSGENPGSIKRIHTEEFLVLKEFFSLIDTHEVLKVFPEAQKYVVDGKICEKYALAKLMFESPRNSYRLTGIQLLYELFQSSKTEEEIKQLYGYTRKTYNQDKQKYDIFQAIPESRYLKGNIYLNGEKGYTEEEKISTNAFIQQTDAFLIKIDLNDYTREILSKIRVDLDEGRYRKFKIDHCTCDGECVDFKPINGITKGEWTFFYTADPQYEFQLKNKGILKIEGYTEELSCIEVEHYYRSLQRREENSSAKKMVRNILRKRV